MNGDRVIYLKAKELENAYWGYDVEGGSDEDSDGSDVSPSDESSGRQTRSRRARKRSSRNWPVKLSPKLSRCG
jgi:hypothetical protein